MTPAVAADRLPLALTGAAYALGASLALGTLGPLSNIAYDAGMGSTTFAALRATIGAVVLVALVFRRPRVPLASLGGHDRRVFGLALAAQSVLQVTLFAAFVTTSVALALGVYYLYPLVVAGLSIALGRERLTLVRALALVLAVGGVVVLVVGRLGPDTEAPLLGLAFAAAAGLSQATYLVAARHGFRSLPANQAMTWILLGVALTSWAVALPVDGGAGRLLGWVGDPITWLVILVAGVIGAAMAKVWVLEGVRRLGGTRASVLLLAEPVAGVLLAAALLGQPFGLPEAIGGLGVLAGAVLVQRPTAPTGMAGLD